MIGATFKLLGLAAIPMVAAGLARPANAATQVVRMANIAYAPAAITVHVGDTLEWDNGDIVAHTATSKEAGFNVNVPPDKKGATVVKKEGSYSYTCRYHPNMKGEITVEP